MRYEAKTEDNDTISEKVRKLLGEIPPSIVRWGTVVMAIVITGLVLELFLIPYLSSESESILIHILRKYGPIGKRGEKHVLFLLFSHIDVLPTCTGKQIGRKFVV